tara:strand:- start:20 stop:319 length:300 start_codon:yes stop_codon:yes gene_type:complete
MVGCDQIESRLFDKRNESSNLNSTTKSNLEFHSGENNETTFDKTQSKSLIIDNKKNKNPRLQLIDENSKKELIDNNYSVIGTINGKPIRNDSSKKISTD